MIIISYFHCNDLKWDKTKPKEKTENDYAHVNIVGKTSNSPRQD